MENEKLYIIDATGPFFVGHPKTLINWSKVPYHIIEKKGAFSEKRYNRIKQDFKKYVKHIARLGYTAISIDDLCHLIIFDFYPTKLKEKIEKYQEYFKEIFTIALSQNLKIFVTTDIMFYNEYIETKVSTLHSAIQFMNGAIEKCFSLFPEVSGIITRIGESDGVDVKGDFASKITLKTPKDVRYFLKHAITLFEKHNKLLIFRTWTLGAYKVGDLMYNSETYRACFKNVSSKNFIVSMKYGEGDFFRYAKLNKNFFEKDNIKKIIELQTRREYEGFGEYPAYIGTDYEEYYNQLKDNPLFMGISVWCQTGGWSNWRNFTFLKHTSYWNELNTAVTLAIFKGISASQAALLFYGGKKKKKFLEFLRLSEEVVKELLYDPPFAQRELYFNKVKVPPLLHISWNNITVSPPIIVLYRLFNNDIGTSFKLGYKALVKIKKMKSLGQSLALPYDARFHYDTFRLFFDCRNLIYSHETELHTISKRLQRYHERYNNGYKFHISIGSRKRRRLLAMLMHILIRKNAKPRFIDRLLFNPITAGIYLFIYKKFNKLFPKFLGKQAMPPSVFLT